MHKEEIFLKKKRKLLKHGQRTVKSSLKYWMETGTWLHESSQMQLTLVNLVQMWA